MSITGVSQAIRLAQVREFHQRGDVIGPMAGRGRSRRKCVRALSPMSAAGGGLSSLRQLRHMRHKSHKTSDSESNVEFGHEFQSGTAALATLCKEYSPTRGADSHQSTADSLVLGKRRRASLLKNSSP